MTVLVILASVAAIAVAVITIWNAAAVSQQRLRVQRAIRERRVRKQLVEQTTSFASEPTLVEFEDRFDELLKAYEAKRLPGDLAALWARAFRLAGESPVGTPFRYGALVVHRDMNAMTVRKGSASITGGERLKVYPIPLSPRSAIQSSSSAIPVVKD